MYIVQIIWLLTWPALIIGSYLLIKFVLKKFEGKEEKQL